MRLDNSGQLFFGCKIDSKLREALAQAKPGDRRYFEDPESPYLRICAIGDERWIGKVVKTGVNVTEVEDIQRNVTSILRRIAPGVRQSPSSVRIFAVDELSERERSDLAEASDLEGESGPYIANY